MKTNVYISGKITGATPRELGFFAKAEYRLRKQGYEPINPLKLDHSNAKEWIDYIATDLKALYKCDAIFLLDNFLQSTGARIEYYIAKELGLEIMQQNGLAIIVDDVDRLANVIEEALSINHFRAKNRTTIYTTARAIFASLLRDMGYTMDNIGHYLHRNRASVYNILKCDKNWAITSPDYREKKRDIITQFNKT